MRRGTAVEVAETRVGEHNRRRPACQNCSPGSRMCGVNAWTRWSADRVSLPSSLSPVTARLARRGLHRLRLGTRRAGRRLHPRRRTRVPPPSSSLDRALLPREPPTVGLLASRGPRRHPAFADSAKGLPRRPRPRPSMPTGPA